MYNFQIETFFVNLNLLAGNPGSSPAYTIYFILFTWASPYGTHSQRRKNIKSLKTGIQFDLLLSPYLCFISMLFFYLYVLGDDALIS